MCKARQEVERREPGKLLDPKVMMVEFSVGGWGKGELYSHIHVSSGLEISEIG
jgi:hypothetical protein